MSSLLSSWNGRGSPLLSMTPIWYNFASLSWSSINSSLSCSNLLIIPLSSSIVWSFCTFIFFKEIMFSSTLSSSISWYFLLRGFLRSFPNLPLSSKGTTIILWTYWILSLTFWTSHEIQVLLQFPFSSSSQAFYLSPRQHSLRMTWSLQEAAYLLKAFIRETYRGFTPKYVLEVWQDS